MLIVIADDIFILFLVCILFSRKEGLPFHMNRLPRADKVGYLTIKELLFATATATIKRHFDLFFVFIPEKKT